MIHSHTIPAVNEDSSLTIQLSHLDISDVDSNSFTVTVHDGANYSKVGNTITPAANFSGTITVPITVSDGGAVSDTLNASVTVNAINDAPVIAGGDSQSIATDQDNAQSFTLNASDVDNSTLTWSEYTSPSHGSVSGYGAGLQRSLTYTPASGFHGTDSFVVQVSDGIAVDRVTVTVQVNQVDQEFAEKFSGIVDDAALVTPSVPANVAVGALTGEGGVSGGSAIYSIPVALPPGRAGMQPDVSLNYSSRGGNGVAGVGWQLSASASIHRCAATQAQDGFTASPQYSASRDRLCLNGQRLIVIEGNYGQHNAKYRTELDSFVKVEQNGAINDPTSSFTVFSKNGRISYYGTTSDSLHSADGRNEVLSWAIAKVEDQSGNFIEYRYHTPANNNSMGKGEYTLASIHYTGNAGSEPTRKVVFDYEGRTDYQSSYLAGGLTRKTLRLKSIKTYYDDAIVRDYQLTYGNLSLSSGRTLLRSVKECAYKDSLIHCLPATEFDWQEATTQYVLEPVEFAQGGSTVAANVADKISRAVPKSDVDGDGVRDWPGLDTNKDGVIDVPGIMVNAERQVKATHTMPTDGCVVRASMGFARQCLTADFNQDGKTDFYKTTENTGGEIQIQYNGTTSWVSSNIHLNYYQDGILSFSDFNGDGWPDITMKLATSDTAVPKVYLYPHTKNVNQPYTTASRQWLFDLTSDLAAPFTNKESVEQVGDMDGNGTPDFVIMLKPATGQLGMPYPHKMLLSQSQLNGGVQFTEYLFSGHLQLEDATDKGGANFFHDINGDGLPDWLSMNTNSTDNYWLEARINTGGDFAAGWIDLNVMIPTRLYWKYHSNAPGDREGYRLPVIEKTLAMDYDGDGKTELLFASDVVASACSLEFYIQNGQYRQKYFCDEALWGHSSALHSSPIDGARKDVSARKYQAIYFDENADGSISTRIEQTDIVAAPTEKMAIDATGDGLIDVVTTFECQVEGCAWNVDAEQHGGTKKDTSLKADRLYINRNLGAASNTNGYETIDVIKQVTTGLGTQNQWTYRPLGSDEFDITNGTFYDPDHAYVSGDVAAGDQEYFHFSSSMMVVAEHRVSNGIGSDLNATHYRYKGAIYNNQGRGFQGFRTIIVDSPAQIGESGAITDKMRSVTDFHQKFPKAGKIEEVRTCLASDGIETCSPTTPLSYTKNIYFEKKTAESSDTNSE
ncbi:Ig-like domain-containing protein, partial [Aliikangiella coralliicola]|uniref:Ig-like domain-containing protein n=1 Tax=Aliikangiella coralliicola TaxID=2592383 RepID=UPI001AEF68A9